MSARPRRTFNATVTGFWNFAASPAEFYRVVPDGVAGVATFADAGFTVGAK